MPWTRDGTSPPPERHRVRARALRRRPTEPEKRLWWHIRHRLPLRGTHFRRQVPLGPYIVDFCCLEHRLIIEVDGHQHGLDEHARRDEERTGVLAGQGFRVLRFSNAEVMTKIDVVLDTILAACGPTPATPGPSLPGEARTRVGEEKVVSTPVRA